ncbi:MAG: 3-phosphoshikimate 1-carboxyvinyltransferase [Bacteroidota bacterium]|jgi:3-phosphoshikimate 1-carboxyvinyltransferase|nr:3-phosphoshikimate 1-carboxyvinyltransferase [Bacteroidota bacterium]
MNYRISHPAKKISGTIELTASKSESNRALIIQALCEEEFEIKNLAKAQDTQTLEDILYTPGARTIDVGPAGTVMRFLTAYYSSRPGTRILTGSDRMKKRPIGILVEALRQLGANITYTENDGFPPIKIEGRTLKGGEIEIDGSVSSQFISALLLISPVFQNGLVIKFKGEVTSRPYINMTLKMLEEFRVYGVWHDNSISVSKQNYHVKSESDYAYSIEGDWSSASYWYAMVALAQEADLTVKGLKNPSLQGDSIVADVFSFFGVKTEYITDGIRLTKIRVKDEHFGFDFSDCPDIAQTVALTAAALQIPCFLNGLHTLRIKETDRIVALRNELKKMNVEVEILSDQSIKIIPSDQLKAPEIINTYEDHRMAMAFAALALKLDSVVIEQPEVVKKSYPAFWNDLKKLGFQIEEV